MTIDVNHHEEESSSSELDISRDFCFSENIFWKSLENEEQAEDEIFVKK